MYAYIARQPIFNVRKEVDGYELLYRDGESGNVANITDGDQATRRLLSDAIMLFGLPKLTNGRPAFVNFTENLLLSDFAYMANPKEVVVEILESNQGDPALIQKLEEMKNAGYTLALDDYTGDPKFDRLLHLADIIKVDFRLTDRAQQKRLAEELSRWKATLLAEKVETLEDFDAACEMGYTLFQGYFFEKPRMFSKRFPSVAASCYGRMLREIQRKDVDFDVCARIVHSDAYMTYTLMQKIHTLNYYHGNLISSIKHGLVMLGVEELRRWVFLLLARQGNITHSEELPRRAYLRALFLERLMERCDGAPPGEQGFLLGMFSLLDKILGIQMEEILKDMALDPALKAALLGEENAFSRFLQYAVVYEMTNPNLLFPDIGLRLDDQEVSKLYMKCIVDTDETFGLSVGRCG